MKKKLAKKKSSKRLSNSKLMLLGFILLFIVFEALYVMKAQKTLQANTLLQNVAGVATQK